MEFTGETLVVDLPFSKGTWEILTRPTVLDALKLRPVLEHLQEDCARLSDELGTEIPNDYAALASMTLRWSFDEEIDVAAIMGRDIEDLIAIMVPFADVTVPFLEKVMSSTRSSSSLSPSKPNRASRRNGPKSTSSTKPAGAGRNT